MEHLIEYFPIQRDTMIACLANPISPEFAAELRNMDIRLEGIKDPKIKEVIRNHLIASRSSYPSRHSYHDKGFSRSDPDRRQYRTVPAKHDICLHTAQKTPPSPAHLLPPHPNQPQPPPSLSTNSRPIPLIPISPRSMEKGRPPAMCVGRATTGGYSAIGKREASMVFVVQRHTR